MKEAERNKVNNFSSISGIYVTSNALKDGHVGINKINPITEKIRQMAEGTNKKTQVYFTKSDNYDEIDKKPIELVYKVYEPNLTEISKDLIDEIERKSPGKSSKRQHKSNKKSINNLKKNNSNEQNLSKTVNEKNEHKSKSDYTINMSNVNFEKMDNISNLTSFDQFERTYKDFNEFMKTCPDEMSKEHAFKRFKELNFISKLNVENDGKGGLTKNPNTVIKNTTKYYK